MKLIFCITLIVSFIFLQTHAQGTWSQKASLHVGRHRAVAFSIGNFGYVGTGGNGIYLKDLWKFDPAEDSWEEVASMPTMGRIGAMSFAINGKGYVGGGVNERNGGDIEFWEYDPQLNNWSKKCNLPKYPYSNTTQVSFAIGDKGYLFSSGYIDDFWEYDPQTDTWTRKADFPGVGLMNQVGFSIGSKGYIGTGYPGGLSYTPEFWEYDPAFNKWTKKADFPGIRRNSAVGFGINNSGFIGLGSALGSVFQEDFWEYHPETNIWNKIENSGYFAADAVAMSIGNKGYVGTGLWGGIEFWEYSPDLSSANKIETCNGLAVYPNPVSEKLCFTIDYAGPINYSIYSAQGQLMISGITLNQTVSVSEIPQGLFFLKIQTAKQTSVNEFIKQ
jgi:N-acetylneuraminic acid mutarotase